MVKKAVVARTAHGLVIAGFLATSTLIILGMKASNLARQRAFNLPTLLQFLPAILLQFLLLIIIFALSAVFRRKPANLVVALPEVAGSTVAATLATVLLSTHGSKEFKLAEKHHRRSILHPKPLQAPVLSVARTRKLANIVVALPMVHGLTSAETRATKDLLTRGSRASKLAKKHPELTSTATDVSSAAL